MATNRVNVNKSIVSLINNIFGNDLNKLKNAHYHYNTFYQKRVAIEKKVIY